jgi:hypothetical protein
MDSRSDDVRPGHGGQTCAPSRRKARMSMNWLAGLCDEDGTVLIPARED